MFYIDGKNNLICNNFQISRHFHEKNAIAKSPRFGRIIQRGSRSLKWIDEIQQTLKTTQLFANFRTIINTFANLRINLMRF